MLFYRSCGRLCGKTSDFRGDRSNKNALLLNLDKKRTHQAFLLGEFDGGSRRIRTIDLPGMNYRKFNPITKHIVIFHHKTLLSFKACLGVSMRSFPLHATYHSLLVYNTPSLIRSTIWRISTPNDHKCPLQVILCDPRGHDHNASPK